MSVNLVFSCGENIKIKYQWKFWRKYKDKISAEVLEKIKNKISVEVSSTIINSLPCFKVESNKLLLNIV